MSSFNNLTKGEYLETSEHSFFIRRVGKGSPLIIVHGGPGLEHSYLFDWLLPLSKYRTLILYDQCGCGRDKTPISQVSASKTFDQLSYLIESLDISNDIGLFGHSWGANVILSFLKSNASCVKEVIISNPMALTKERFEKAGERLWMRIPEEKQKHIIELNNEKTESAGLKLMQTALPYYIAPSDSIPDIDWGSYRILVYDRILETLGDFDFTDFAVFLPDRTLILYGKKDFGQPEDSKELQNSSNAKIILLPNLGHFPFAENPESYLSAINLWIASNQYPNG